LNTHDDDELVEVETCGRDIINDKWLFIIDCVINCLLIYQHMHK